MTRAGGSGRRGLGRWIAAAAAAVLLALLLLAGGLVLANRGGDSGANVASRGTTTTAAADTTAPSFESPTSVLVPTSIDPVGPSTAVGDGSTTTTTATTTTAPAAAPGAGVLETSVGDLVVPKVDATSGSQANRLTLRNTGGVDLSYTTQSSSPALTASPAQGTIPAGRGTEVTVTLLGSKLTAEGPFNGTLSFGGTGGRKVVQISSIVGRPPSILDNAGESCAAPSASCSRQIKVSAPPSSGGATPCNMAWFYSVVISDQSRVQTARTLARRNLANADAPLVAYGHPPGTSGLYVSSLVPPLAAGTVLRFMLEAVDQFGFTVRLAQQTIYC